MIYLEDLRTTPVLQNTMEHRMGFSTGHDVELVALGQRTTQRDEDAVAHGSALSDPRSKSMHRFRVQLANPRFGDPEDQADLS